MDKQRGPKKKIKLEDDDGTLPLQGCSSRIASKRLTRGYLQGVVDMPVDVLLEIFGHLTPFDLLRATRTSRGFRKMLMTKSASSTWMRSRENVDPPLHQPPPGMSEPEWANLVFDPHCHYCGNVVHQIEWRFRKRICTACLIIHTRAEMDLLAPDNVEEWHVVAVILRLVPTRLTKPQVSARQHRICVLDEFNDIKAKYIGLNTDEDRQAFILAQVAVREALEEHSKESEEWMTSVTAIREEQLRDVKKERENAILAKLRCLGYQKDLRTIPDVLQYHKHFRISRPLTERGWKTIEASLVEVMEGVKSKRLASERATLINKRKAIAISVLHKYKTSKLPYNSFLPNPADFCDLPEIKAILEQQSDVVVNARSFRAVEAKFDQIFTRWRNGLLHKLHGLTRDAKEYKKEIELATLSGVTPKQITPERIRNTLSLATTAFSCSSCASRQSMPNGKIVRLGPLLLYPDVLDHPCLSRTEKNYHFLNPEEREDPSRRLGPYSSTRRLNWQSAGLTCDPTMKVIVESVMRAYDPKLDLSKVTVEEMDRVNAFWTCAHPACQARGGNKDAAGADNHDGVSMRHFGWRAAVDHIVKCGHYPLSEMTWVVRPWMPSLSSALSSMEDTPICWLCVHCWDTPQEAKDAQNLSSIKAHLLDTHKIDRPKENVDYYKKFGTPPTQTTTDLQLREEKNGRLNLYIVSAGTSYELTPSDDDDDDNSSTSSNSSSTANQSDSLSAS